MNIKDVKIGSNGFWVKSEKQTPYLDDSGVYYELWGDEAIIPIDNGKLAKVKML